MSAYDSILIAGPKHHRANAERVRAWRRESLTLANRGMFELAVKDWQSRNYLSAEDAAKLLEEAT